MKDIKTHYGITYGCLFVAKLNICMQQKICICYKKYMYATKNICMLQKNICMQQKIYACYKKIYVCYKKYMYARKIYVQGFSVN